MQMFVTCSTTTKNVSTVAVTTTVESVVPTTVHVSTVAVPSFTCVSRANGNYANPDSCESYITCTDDVLEVKKCPQFMWYDASINSCEMQMFVTCSTTTKNVSTVAVTTTVQSVVPTTVSVNTTKPIPT